MVAVVRRIFTVRVAYVYRSTLLRRVVFIAVTGSTAKTTTKELITAVLSRRFKGQKTAFNNNLLFTIAGTLLSVRPSDKFCVVEVAAADGGKRLPIEDVISLVRPAISVVTNVGVDHQSAFGTVDNIAAAKSKLVEGLSENGVAILNADDERVAAMGKKCRGRTILYGLGTGSLVTAYNVRSNWPDRLTFDVRYQGQSYSIRTQFCGEFWVHPVLAAVSVGLEMGVPLSEIAETISNVPPHPRRMEPISSDENITFIRDDQKTPITSVPLALHFMECARARRKIVIFGTISDYKGNSDRMFVSVARQALAVADHVLFVGPRSNKCLKASKGLPVNTLRAFLSLNAVSEFLAELLRPGDLVLLKGTDRDNLVSLIQTHVLRKAEGPIASVSTLSRRNQVRCIVGLGNVGERYADTPHNIGQQVVDLMAHSFRSAWADIGTAHVAECGGSESVYLVKLKTNVNNSGPVLFQVTERLGVAASECLVVHDDADLPFGTVRLRASGSDGGHRGVRSILSKFGTDEIRRVKVGVKSSSQARLAEHVIASIALGDRKKADDACIKAVKMLAAIVWKKEMDLFQMGPTEGFEPPTS